MIVLPTKEGIQPIAKGNLPTLEIDVEGLGSPHIPTIEGHGLGLVAIASLDVAGEPFSADECYEVALGARIILENFLHFNPWRIFSGSELEETVTAL